MSQLWAISVRGPDDLIAAPGALAAHHAANAFNVWWTKHIEAKGLHEHDPHMWASPVVWPYTAEAHAEAIANPSAEYNVMTPSHGREGAE